MRNGWLIFAFNVFSVPGFCQPATKQIDSLMNAYYPSDQPGAVIAIEQNNKTIFKKGYGKSNLITGLPITTEVNFNIGSLTKQFTAFAVLDLFYKGKFSRNDSIGKFLKLPHPVSSAGIFQLLSHCSGIPDHYGFTDTNAVKHATDKDVLAALQKANSLYFPSGTHYRYSNTAYCLLGMLIEKLSGISYGEYLQKNIFMPLDIYDATVFQFSHPISRRVTGYDLSPGRKFVQSDANESIFFSTEADGGLYISMNNYMKWCRAIESGKFSNSEMIRNAWQGQTLVDTLKGLWYGNGWFIRQLDGSKKVVYHTGFNGGFRTVVYMIPSANYCISIFSNRGDIDLEELVTRINQILGMTDNSFIKSGPLESFIHSWPIFAPCKETRSFSTSFIRNWNGKDMVLN
jgi:CubicO group peptidase (beta-lactamase class C family)